MLGEVGAIQAVRCDWGVDGGVASIPGKLRPSPGHVRRPIAAALTAQYFLKIECDLDGAVEAALARTREPVAVDIRLTLAPREGENAFTPFVHRLVIAPRVVPVPAPGSVGICLPPLYGDELDVDQLVEWREHHRSA